MTLPTSLSSIPTDAFSLIIDFLPPQSYFAVVTISKVFSAQTERLIENKPTVQNLCAFQIALCVGREKTDTETINKTIKKENLIDAYAVVKGKSGAFRKLVGVLDIDFEVLSPISRNPTSPAPPSPECPFIHEIRQNLKKPPHDTKKVIEIIKKYLRGLGGGLLFGCFYEKPGLFTALCKIHGNQTQREAHSKTPTPKSIHRFIYLQPSPSPPHRKGGAPPFFPSGQKLEIRLPDVN